MELQTGHELVASGNPSPSHGVISVDTTLPLEAMIAAGMYDHLDDEDITPENFPITDSGEEEWEFDLVHPNRAGIITSDEARRETAKDSDPANPWVDGKIEHLLAFGAKYPEVQLEFAVIALGAVAQIHNMNHTAVLDDDGSDRRIRLAWMNFDEWGDPTNRFLRVRKKVSVSAAPSPLA